MKPVPQMAKIEMIERSLRCFALGLLGLLPVIGIPMAVAALGQYWRVKRASRGIWNPAGRYLFWGGICARLGLILVTFLTLTIIWIVLLETTHLVDNFF